MSGETKIKAGPNTLGIAGGGIHMTVRWSEEQQKRLRDRLLERYPLEESAGDGPIPEPDEFDIITNIDDVLPGDIAVIKNGNRHKVTKNDHNTISSIRAEIEELGSDLWIFSEYFDHAERAKPKVPTEPGFYRDHHGALWLRADERVPWRKLTACDGTPLSFENTGAVSDDGMASFKLTLTAVTDVKVEVASC